MKYTRLNLSVLTMIIAASLGCTGQSATNADKQDLMRAGKADAAGWDQNSSATCEDTCVTSFDGECDDGRPGADWSICAPGTDCGDCGDARDGQGECAPTGVACLQACSDAMGAPCQEGNWNEETCTCDPLDDGQGECAPTGVPCLMDCSGAMGAPCQEGTWNEESCTCDPLDDGQGECAPTGVACLLDCSESMGAPCQEGAWNAQTCTCDAPM